MLKTVNTVGDGKDAVTRYLAGGGTLVVLASGPFPFYYGYGPADAPGAADPLLPIYGMPFIGFEQAPSGIFMQTEHEPNHSALSPDSFSLPARGPTACAQLTAAP